MQEIINLKGLLNIYTNTVCDKIFEFTLPKNKKIKLAFYRESMCHLMGLQYIFDNPELLEEDASQKIELGENR